MKNIVIILFGCFFPTMSHSALTSKVCYYIDDSSVAQKPCTSTNVGFNCVPDVNGNCPKCEETTVTDFETHVVTKQSQTLVGTVLREVTSDGVECTITCRCKGSGTTTYSCASGYCGNPTSSSGICTAIPANGTCVSGGIQCNSGYNFNPASGECEYACNNKQYFNGVECVACPDNASCDNDDRTVRCNPGYYRTAFFSLSPTTTTTYSCAECPKNATCAGGAETFKCDIGYYSSGRVMVNGGGCTACPEGGTTDTAGSTSVSACKMVDGGTYFDNTGSYTISGGGCTYKLTTAI